MNIIEICGLTMTYKNGVKALRGISFLIEKPKIIGFLGPNGAGKTTTCEILTTAITPTSGTAFILGKSILKDAKEVRKLITYAPQDYIIDWPLTVWDNLKIFAKLYNIPKKQINNRIEALLDKFGLFEKRECKALELSGGQAKRLQLIRALLPQPKILIADEPMLGLDPAGKLAAFEALRELKTNGTTIFLCTNEMKEVEEVCDEIIFINNGKIIAQDKVDKFIKQYANYRFLEIFYNGTLSSENIATIINAEIVLNEVGLIRIKMPLDVTIHTIIQKLSQQKLEIKDIKIREPSLDDAFLNLVSSHHDT